MADRDRMMTVREIAARTGLHRTSIFRQVASGTFPKPFKLGPKSTRWNESEVEAYLAKCRRGVDPMVGPQRADSAA